MKFWGVVAAVLTLGLGAAWANAMPDAEAAAYLKTLAEKGKIINAVLIRPIFSVGLS